MDEKIGSYHDTCHTIFISHGDCEEDANYVAEKVKEKYQINTIIMNQVGATIGAHSGPGTMALFLWEMKDKLVFVKWFHGIIILRENK